MRIYIVDDDRNIYSILKQIITERKLGEICGSAENGQEALEDVASLKPDIIIADLLMPDLDGITFSEKAKKLLPDASVIMLSQVDNKEMVSKAYESGVEFYVHKPVNAIEIENVLKNIEASQTMKRIIAKAQDLFAGNYAIGILKLCVMILIVFGACMLCDLCRQLIFRFTIDRHRGRLFDRIWALRHKLKDYKVLSALVLSLVLIVYASFAVTV